MLGKAGDICNLISTPSYCDESYSNLVLYANKVLSPWTDVWSRSYRSRARCWLPGVVQGRFRYFCSFWEGLVISITRQICPTIITFVFRSRIMGTHRHVNASVAGIWPISSLKGKVLAPGGRSGQIFEILRGAGDIYRK